MSNPHANFGKTRGVSSSLELEEAGFNSQAGDKRSALAEVDRTQATAIVCSVLEATVAAVGEVTLVARPNWTGAC